MNRQHVQSVKLAYIKYMQMQSRVFYIHTNAEESRRRSTFVFVVLLKFFFLFSVALRPHAGHGLLILEVSRSHTTTHHSR